MMKTLKSQSEIRVDCIATLNRHKITETDFKKKLRNRGLSDGLISVVLTNPAAITQYFRKYQLTKTQTKKGEN